MAGGLLNSTVPVTSPEPTTQLELKKVMVGGSADGGCFSTNDIIAEYGHEITIITILWKSGKGEVLTSSEWWVEGLLLPETIGHRQRAGQRRGRIGHRTRDIILQ